MLLKEGKEGEVVEIVAWVGDEGEGGDRGRGYCTGVETETGAKLGMERIHKDSISLTNASNSV